MGDWSSQALVPPLFLSTWSNYAAMATLRLMRGATTCASANWVADMCEYIPMVLPWDYPVRRVFWVNGTTITTTTVAFAIYTRDDANGAALVYSTGAVTQAGASIPQYVTPTAFILPAGNYYFAISCNNTTSRSWSNNSVTAEDLRFCGVLQQATAHPPPSPPTPVAATQVGYWLCGVTQTPSGF